MACPTCNCQPQWHGSQTSARPSSHLFESGCHDGVLMDDDVHAEGWQRDVIYPPCPNNPNRCSSCNGSGEAGPEVTTQDDCPGCDGTGWKDGKAQWPEEAIAPVTLLYARMERARRKGKGVRLSIDDLEAMHTETVGEWMSKALEDVSPLPAAQGGR